MLPDPSTPQRLARRRRMVHLRGGDRLSIFVPAVMSVGLLFWLLSQLRDVAHSRRRRNRIKQARLAARTIAAELTAAEQVHDAAEPDELLDGPRRWRSGE